MDLVLLKDWNGMSSGMPLIGVQAGQAEIMIARGIAKRVNSETPKENLVESHTTRNKRSNVRTVDTRPS
jgi:hypothetical protein